MATATVEQTARGERPQTHTLALIAVAATVALVHILTNNRYGFHRDELQTLSDALHLDWGFVAYPPFTPFVERISLGMFGLSLVGLRLFSVIAQAAAVVVTGLMTRELGGRRLAQITAGLAVALAPLSLFEGTEFQYTTFDYLWWVLAAYFVIRLLNSDDPRWCLAIGATVGLGLMTKYTMCFYAAGIAGGMLLTRSRRYFATRWFWGGVALAFLICLPNLIWQVRHEFVSLHFLQHIHARDVGEGRAEGFLREQFRICTNLFSVPLWIAGLVCFFRDRRYRMLAWMYVIPLALFLLTKARFYYLAAAYPALLAMGSTAGEHWVAGLSRPLRWALEGVILTGLVLCGMYFGAMIIPLAPSGPLRDFALKNNGDLREEIGWDELVKTVAGIRDGLPAEQQQNARVLVGNYGSRGRLRY
jgi:4-amino-4-deoxy-L-arabinose transferase-like glycosyltransferase